MKIFTDQLQRTISLSGVPVRIVSLVPSLTELLTDLGLAEYIIGVTKFCVHPSYIKKSKVVVGGTKVIDYTKIHKINPHIILCNKEENTLEIVNKLQAYFPVHVSDIKSIDDALDIIHQYGVIFEVENQAKIICGNIVSELNSFRDYLKEIPIKRVAYFIWRNPWMVAANNTFIDHMLHLNKFDNVFESYERYPEVTKKQIKELQNIDCILLSSEPFPFNLKHVTEFQKMLQKDIQIQLVDGTYFSWYGSRLGNAFEYFKTLHH